MFTIENIKDKDLLNRIVDEETDQIFRRPGRRGRSYDELRASVLQGKVAELYLVETGKYKFCDLKYHDLYNQKKQIIEVKAYSSTEILPPFVIKDIRKIQSLDWNKSDWYYYFGVFEGVYTLHQRIKLK